MIIFTIQCKCKNSSYIFNKYLIKCCDSNNYISSIEYIDNEFEDILIKRDFKFVTTYVNVHGFLHNPVGPARIYYKDGLITFVHYYNNGIYKKSKRFI